MSALRCRVVLWYGRGAIDDCGPCSACQRASGGGVRYLAHDVSSQSGL